MTRLAESKNRLTESKAIFNRLAELFFQLAESMHIFIQLSSTLMWLAEYLQFSIHSDAFQAKQGLQSIDLPFYKLSLM